MITYDVAIAGLGAMGSAAAWQLSLRGVRVIGFDRFAPPHAFGSSHGETRIIREAYFEHPQYVPLVQRAYECWAEVERESGERLLEITGGLMAGPPGGALVEGALRSAVTHGLDHEVMDAAEIRRRFPALRPPAGTMGIWEPRAGMLFPETCIAACLRLAARSGADIRVNEPVTGWTPDGDGVEVRTSRDACRAGTLVVSAGAWAPALLPGVEWPLVVQRNVLHWFAPRRNAGDFSAGRLPIWLLEFAPGEIVYGFPTHGTGVKVARHHFGPAVHPDTLDRRVAREEADDMRPILGHYLPDLNGEWLAGTACMYTNTPDGDFVIDRHPGHPAVLVVSPCSGHGFKFASVVGEIVADLVTLGQSQHDLSPFRATRFARA